MILFCLVGTVRMVLGWLRWRAWAGVAGVGAAVVVVAGMALCDVVYMALGWLRWRAWAWRGRYGTLRHLPSFYVVGMTRGDIVLYFE